MKARYLIILVIVCVILGVTLDRWLFFDCPEIITTDTVYVDVIHYDTIVQEKPVPYKITEVNVINDTTYLYIPVDTAAILADYYRIREYDDVLKDDSTGYVRLTEKVSQNALFDRKLYFEARSQDKIINNTQYRTGFYGYGAIGSDLRGFYPAAGIMYQNNKGLLYGAGIGLYQKPYLYFNIAIPIR